MSETITKRLIGQEDVNWDVNGSGEQADFPTSDGGTKTLHKINAGHIPLKSATQEKTGHADVDSALDYLKDAVDSLAGQDMMQENTIVDFTINDSILDIETKIRQSKKNLGGFTLTFRFAASFDRVLSDSSIHFDGFYNGYLVIEGNGITVSDTANIERLFVLNQLSCRVTVQNFNFVHSYSKYGVSCFFAQYITFKSCNFTGNSGSYGIRLYHGTGGYDTNCTFTNDGKIDNDPWFNNRVIDVMEPSTTSYSKSCNTVYQVPAAGYIHVVNNNTSSATYASTFIGKELSNGTVSVLLSTECTSGNGIRGRSVMYIPKGWYFLIYADSTNAANIDVLYRPLKYSSSDL